MARWRLLTAHYLKVPGTEWEYEESVQHSNRKERVRFPVPLYLNPEDQADWNTPDGIVVCYADKGERRDIVFVGEPTPDMEPLDEEARQISESFKHKWVHPIETLPSTGDYTQSLIAGLEKQIAAAASAMPKPQNLSVSQEEFNALKEQLAAVAAKNAELEQALQETRTRRV